jgi:hypothetical protein
MVLADHDWPGMPHLKGIEPRLINLVPETWGES